MKRSAMALSYGSTLRSRDVFSRATSESNDEASELFQRAIYLDPIYADAYAAFARSHYEMVIPTGRNSTLSGQRPDG